MGIQIKGSNDTISAADGSIVLEGATLTFTNENITGISTMASAEVTGGLKIGTNSVTANVAGDDLKIEGASDRGLSIISGSSSSGNIYFGDSSDADIGRVMYNHNDNALQVYTNASASPKVTIDSGGRVGIGTVPLASEGAELNIRSSDGATNVGLIPNTNSEFSQLTFYNATNDSAQGYIKYNNSDNSLQVRVNLKERLRISSSGLVGINTTAPTALLSFGVQRSVQTFPPICFQTAHGSGLADAAISTTDDSGGTDIMMGANVYMGQNGTFTRYFSSYGSAAVRCGYTGNTMFYNKSGNNAPAEAMRINGSGNVKLGGHSTDRDLGGLSVQRLHIEGTDGGSSSMSLVNNQNSTGSAGLYFSKSRGTSLNSNTILQVNDPMGSLVFCGSDGNDMISQGAQIAAHVDGTPGSNDMPGRLTFSTTADGAVTVTDRVRINHKGFQGPLPRTGTWQGTIVYKQQSQGANYEHKIRGPLSGYLDTEMDSNFVAYIKVQTIGTGTDNAYCYYSLSQDGENLGATLTHLGGNSGSNSNMPYMVLDGQHACWKTAHATQYNFVVRVEITGGNEEQTYTATGSYAAN